MEFCMVRKKGSRSFKSEQASSHKRGRVGEVGGDQLISVNQLMDILQTYTDHMLHCRKSLYTQFVNNPDSLVQFLTHKLLHI